MPRLHFDCRLRYPSGFTLAAAFTAADGVTALFGPSGSGKSTVFALIAGTQRPDAGAIRLGEQVLAGDGVCLPPERRRIGVVFQDHRLFPHLSVRDNLCFGLGRAGARPIALERVVDILEIGALLDRRPNTLSGGQQQRVSLGRAILRGPELLLMDEPLTALDEGLKDRVLAYLERVVAEWGVPTLFISHDQAEVRRLASQVVVLEAGQVVATGPTQATLDRVSVTRAQTQPPLVNLLQVVDLRQADGHWLGRVGVQTLHVPAGDGWFQFWPKDVTLAVSDHAGLSVRNQLLGQVRQLVPVLDRVFVAVDVGQLIWAEITPQAATDLALSEGRSVRCLIKTSAMTAVR